MLPIETGHFSDTGPYRPRNEDVASASEDRRVLVVADGLGGAAAGEEAARIANDVVQSFLGGEVRASTAVESLLPDGSSRALLLSMTPHDELLSDPADRLRFALLLAHSAVLAEGRESGCVGMSTAIIVAWFAAAGWTLGHVGDCRAYALGCDGLRLLTSDHSLSTALTGRRSLPAHGEDSPFLRSRLTQVIGGEQAPVPDVLTLATSPGDRLLLCTDGVWGSLSSHEIEDHLGAGESAEEVSKALVNAALDAGSRDNATALVACF